MEKFSKSDVEKSILITHKECLDGAGSQILWELAGGHRLNAFGAPAGGVDDLLREDWFMALAEGRPLLICDVSPKEQQTWQFLRERKEKTAVLDHHLSAEKFLKKNEKIFSYSVEKCGTMLMFDFLGDILSSDNRFETRERAYQFARAIDRHDRWLDTMTSEDANYAILHRLIGSSAFVKSIVGSYECIKEFKMSSEERIAVAYEKKRLDKKLETLMRNVQLMKTDSLTHGDIIYGCLVVSDDNSRVLNEVLIRFPEIDVAVGISHEDGSVSLRSREGGPDCSRIAEEHGGGGHARAAGFRVNVRDLTDFMTEIL